METLARRVAGFHTYRFDGMTDLLLQCRGKSCLDIGCNRGHVSLELCGNGAVVLHGVDNFEEGIQVARHNFADNRSVENRFEVVDLTKRYVMKRVFGGTRYDIVTMFATYHKLKRVMTPEDMNILMDDLAERTKEYFAWRATSEKLEENEHELLAIDAHMGRHGIKRIHTSYISKELGVAAIWERK